MIGSLLQADFEEIIAAKDWDGLRDALSEIPSVDIAELIVDLPPEDEGIIFRMLARERAATVFEYLPIDHQQGLVQSLSGPQLQTVLNDMTPDDRTRLFEELPAEVTRRLLESLSPEALKEARLLLGYPDETAGRYMTPEYVALPPDITAREALERIRKTGRGKETLAIIYLTSPEGRLLEDLRLGSLVLADPETMIGDIEDRPPVYIEAYTPVEEVISAFARYDRHALPVVDKDRRMLGIITADDVLDFARQQATDEIQRLGGSEALDKPYFDVGFWSMVKKRGGWLAALFLGEMLTATAMGYFEGEIEKAAVVALFVPLIISSGGNSGSQGTSLIIRSLALQEVKLRDWWRVFGREIRTGLALGLFLGIIGFARIGVWQGLSRVPAVGSFFQTQAGKLPEGAVERSTVLTQPVVLDAAVTFPAGTVIARNTAMPPDAPVTLSADAAHLGTDAAHSDTDAAHRGTDAAHPASPPGSELLKKLAGVHPEQTAYGPHWMLIGWTVLFSLIGVIMWGSLAGSMLPFILRRLGFDPATSSAPFVATLVDVTGLIIYFTVASLILRGTLL
jgi:magnesium transporter